MVKAVWNNKVIAESDQTLVVEGNHYFPPESADKGCLVESPTRTTCPWKGEARYFHVVVDGQTNADACWTYPAPKKAAAEIRGRLAFWKGVRTEE